MSEVMERSRRTFMGGTFLAEEGKCKGSEVEIHLEGPMC